MSKKCSFYIVEINDIMYSLPLEMPIPRRDEVVFMDTDILGVVTNVVYQFNDVGEYGVTVKTCTLEEYKEIHNIQKNKL
jgi:hypothetical protein